MAQVVFQSGIDIMSIAAGTTKVTGNGDIDTVDFSTTYGYSWNYTIVANADGTFSVSDVHGGSIVNALMVGIADLKFADKTVQLVPANHTVTFAAGVDTMAIPAGTLEVIGNGAVDTVDFSSTYGYAANYKIVANSGGTFSVTDVHGGSIVNALMVGIANLKFADGTLNLASGSLSSNQTSASPAFDAATSGRQQWSLHQFRHGRRYFVGAQRRRLGDRQRRRQ